MAEKKVTNKEEEENTATNTATKKPLPKEKMTKKEAPKKETTKDSNSFAVISTGGKQYVVREGDFLNIEKIEDTPKEGVKITFDEVLLTDNGTTTKVGTPTVSGAKVTAEFVENGRAKKISVIRFRSKSRYFKNRGHRQPYTRVRIVRV